MSNERVEIWAQEVSATVPEDPEQAEASASGPASTHPGRESHFDRPMNEVRVGESPSRPWGYSVPVDDDGDLRDGEAHHRPESPPPAPVHMPSPAPSQRHDKPEPGARKCPFDHALFARAASPPAKVGAKSSVHVVADDNLERPFTPVKRPLPSPSPARPTFINPGLLSEAPAPRDGPQMLFTGPVFIGYPIEQAIQFMQHFQNQ